jgi:hypothetical protein
MSMKAGPLVLVLVLPGCFLANRGVHQPTLDEVSSEGDAALDIVDRAEVLDGATEGVGGSVLDITTMGPGFWMNVSSGSLQSILRDNAPEGTEETEETDAPAGPGAATYEHMENALEALLTADRAVYSLLGEPASALWTVSLSPLEEIEPYLWSVEASVTAPDLQTAELRFNVAWVGVGWLADLRLTTSDGRYDDTLWCNGFVSEDGQTGWWDLYDDDDITAATEWLVEEGVLELGVAPLTWGAANGLSVDGDTLDFELSEAGGTVAYTDNETGFVSSVTVNPDHSGQALIDDYNDELPACWDENLADAVCAR